MYITQQLIVEIFLVALAAFFVTEFCFTPKSVKAVRVIDTIVYISLGVMVAMLLLAFWAAAAHEDHTRHIPHCWACNVEVKAAIDNYPNYGLPQLYE